MNYASSPKIAPYSSVLQKGIRPYHFICFLLVSILTLHSQKGYCIATRYQVAATATPIGAGSICQGAATSVYTHQPTSSSCSVIGSANTNVISYQWVYDGTTVIAGASGTFVVGSSTPAVVTLSAAQSAILSTLSLGAHTLRCRYTPNQSNCSGTAGVAIFSPTLSINILAPPGSITGPTSTCVGLPVPLSATPAGGTWVSSNLTTATINSSSGLLSALAIGTTTISYTLSSGCRSTRVMTVNAASAPISGTSSICEYATATLTHPVPGGTWSSSSPSVLAVSGGTITGVSVGAATITYTLPSGCYVTRAVTVITGPAAIDGSSQVCAGESTTLSNPVAGGTWSSGSLGIATISGTGVVSSFSAGVTNILYTLSNGCAVSKLFSVNPLPAITFTPSSSATVCFGQTATITANSPDPTFALLSQNFDGGLAGWAVTNVSATPLSNWQIVPSPGIDGTIGDGSPMMQSASSLYTGIFTETALTSPSFSTLGYGSATLSFDQYLISTTPDEIVKIEYSIDGGTSWSLVADQLNSFAGSASWSTATADDAVMALPAGAIGQADVRLRFSYKASSFYWFIDNISVTASMPPSTYSWSGPSGLSCTTCTSPDITPTATGANIYSITVTTSAGCSSTSEATVNVNPLPAAISGNLSVCVGSTNSLSSTPGGTWMSDDLSKATIDINTGAITGIGIGTANITYTLPTSCITTAVTTVIPAPAGITGIPTVCVGSTSSLGQATPGGTWASSTPGVATVNSFGVMTGVAAGNATITYTLPSGCAATLGVTVNPVPAAITGTAVACVNASTILSNATPGGFWSSSAMGTATIDGAGMVTGVANGNAIISYSLPTTCFATRTVTINAIPTPILGPTSVCQGSTSVVTNATAGGTWSSSAPALAVVNASGIVSGISAGNLNISYILSATGCFISTPYTVNPLPATITGTMAICKDDVTSFSNTTIGGTWTSSAATTLSIDPSSGLATGVNAGVTTITYTLPTTCRTTASVTVNQLPVPTLGVAEVCVGQTTTLFNFTPGGTWTSGNTAIADVSPIGVVTGISAGQTQIIYTLATGCQRAQTVTVNALPGVITGIPQVCVGQITALGNTGVGGTWSSSNSSVAPVSASGVVSGVSAGAATIIYALSTGCRQTQVIVVNPLPAAITGTATVCEGLTTTLNNASIGGVWTPETPAIATIDASGIVTGVVQGVTNITYTLPTGCERVRAVTVNPTPAPITGSTQACIGLTSTLSSLSAGGSWASGSPAIAPINASGTVTGFAAGTANITYTLPEGCRTTATFVVNPLPVAITGATNVCVGATTTLANAFVGGTWGTASSTTATVSASTGIVTGGSAGTTTVTYTLPTTCIRTTTILVNPLPAPIIGLLNVCTGATTTLSNASPGGIWSSSNTSVASINSGGMAIGVSPTGGVATITYTLPTTCRSVASLVVNPMPANISGATVICKDETTLLSNPTPGGNWSSSDPATATVDGAGLVTGLNAGTATITYSMPTGCQKTINIVINPLPASIVGNTVICQGNGTILASPTVGGTWSSSDPAIAPVNSSGAVIGITPGFSIITYTLPTGCRNTTSVIVNPPPAPITGTASVCAGSTTTLANSSSGGVWSASSSHATVSTTGMVTGIAAGTTNVTYTIANNCRRSITVTVNQLPTLISGASSVCAGLTTVLSNANPSGTWTSSDAFIADVIATSGIVSGNSSGVANITYTLPTGCMRTKSVTVNPAVEAITGVMDVCRGLTTTLACATTDGVWTSGNTSIATVGASTGIVTGVNAGSAIITYRLGTGCLATATVSVNPLPANISGATSVCQGATATLANITAGGSWTSSDALIATVDGTGMVSGIGLGSAIVTYTLPTGCIKTRPMVVNAVPVISSVTGGGSYCSGGTGVNVGLDGSEAGTTYKLWLGTSNVATMPGTAGAIDFGLRTAAGTYNVTAINAAGCVSSMSGSAVIAINPLVTPSVSITASADTVCAASVVTFTANGVNGGTSPAYSWSVNGTPVATTGTYSFSPAPGDVVSVTYTSSESCPSPASVSAMKTITIIPNLTPSISIAVSPDDTVCQGSTAMFNATIINGGDSPTYTWMVGGSIVPGASGPTYEYVPANGQNVICKLNSSYRCPSVNNVSSNTINMRVETMFVPVVSIAVSPGTTVQEGQNVTFTTTVSNAGTAPTYQWTINNSPVPGATNPVFSYSSFSDGDSITCVVYGTGKCGLATVNSVILNVTPATGIVHTALSSGNIKLMPNPNNGEFMVIGTLGSVVDEKVTYEITDVLGQIVYRNSSLARGGVINERIRLNNTLANGMYILNMHTTSDRKAFHFVIKQ